MDKDRVADYELCVGETATNAWKHAGGGIVSLHTLPDAMLVMVTDSGSGIEALALPELALTRGYTTAKSLGVGYKAVISLADQVYPHYDANRLPETWSEMMSNPKW